MATATDIFDFTIIGGGPVGLFAAYYAGLRQMRTKIIDSLDQLGGQLAALYPEKMIYDVAGFPEVLASDLVKYLVKQGLRYGAQVHLSETVRELSRDEARDCWVITSDKGSHYTRTLLIAAGSGAFQPRKLAIASAKAWENRGVHYCVRTKSDFAGKRVLIIGGGDSALDWALNLKPVATEITVIHRRNQFRAHEESVKSVLSGGTPILTFWELKEILSTDNRITGAVIFQNQNRQERTLAIDAILVQVGYVSSLGAIKTWPLQIEGQSIKVDSFMQTNLKGIFAAGDVTTFAGKFKLLVTGFGEAAIAANMAKTIIDPTARAFPGHSSEASPEQITTVASEKEPAQTTAAGGSCYT